MSDKRTDKSVNVLTYTKRELAGYLTGLAGQNIIYNIIATGLAFYFQSVIFIPAIACSLIFALARVWDAVNDPMMGSIVDKTRTKWGKCKPYLLFVPAVICIATILPFINSMYAEPNEKHEVEPAEKAAFAVFDTSSYSAFESVIYDGKEYIVASDSGSWNTAKDADGKTIKNTVSVYVNEEGVYKAVDDPAHCKTIVQEFQSEYGFEKARGSKGVFIIAWAAFAYVLWGMAYTVGDIPLWGVTSLMTEDQNDRAKALALARIFANAGMIGMAFTFIAPNFNGIFTARGMDEAHALRYSYILTAVILTVFASILFEVAGLSVKEKVSQSEKTYSIKDNFRIMWGNKPFRQLLISGVLRSPIQLLSIVAMTLVMYYFFNNNLEGNFGITVVIKVLIMGIGIFGGLIAFSAVIPSLTRRFEKKKLYNFFSVIGAIPYLLIFIFFKIAGGNILGWGWIIIMGAMFFLASSSMGALNVLQSVMIADCIDHEEYTHGVRTDGVFFSGQSFITKLSAGIASLISGIVYAVVGFSDKNIALLNNELLSGADFKTYAGGKYAAAMFFLVSVPPAIGMLLSAIPTAKYALTDEEHTRILNELNAKRSAEKENE
ncbi:MAG: MFS transporter [Clostridiales bacterium]|nr:MFS transporter [Clostridiales bacterium]